MTTESIITHGADTDGNVCVNVERPSGNNHVGFCPGNVVFD